MTTGHFRSQPLGPEWSHTAGAFWWRQCVQEEITGKSWGSVSQLTFFLDRTCTVKSVGSETKLRSFSSMQISVQLQLRYLDFSIFMGCGFSRSGASHCLCSAGRWNVGSLMCVCRNCWAEALVCTKYNESNLCTCHLKTTGWCRRYQWELLFRRIKASF